MAKPPPQPDVLVLGSHPAAYLAAALLASSGKGKSRIVHCTIPDEHPADRLVLVNPALFELHPLLGGLRRKLRMSGAYGLRFLADDPGTANESRSKSSVVCVGRYDEVTHEMARIAQNEGVELHTPKHLAILHVDESGLDVAVNKMQIKPTALILAGWLPIDQAKMLGLPDGWEQGVMHRYTYADLKSSAHIDLGNRPVIPMSLDLKGTLSWGWLMQHETGGQIAVSQPIETVATLPPPQMLQHWVSVLRSHGVVKTNERPAGASGGASGGATLSAIASQPKTIDLPLAGALSQEGVANRTLLIGPAGGFYSASAEDIYPACWSAVFAADVMRKALKEPHLQDALQHFRSNWRTTLGEYLRGPQQNLRFLLPLIYRNEVMTTRLTESILQGKAIVR
jgi:hypothetical protein